MSDHADAAERIISLLGEDGARQLLKLLEQDDVVEPTLSVSSTSAADTRRYSTR